jgi:8-oxo-dGTP diphosphatase
MKLATLCYVRRVGQTLMIHRVKKANDMHQGKWNGLGGKLNPGESPEECAVREIFEESGLQVRNPQLKGFLTFPAFANNEDWYVFVYVVEDFEGELIDSPEGNLRWVDNSDLAALNLWEGDPIFLPWLDQSGIFSAKFIYKDGRLVSHSVVFHE